MADFEIDDQPIADFIDALYVLQGSFPKQARAIMRRVGNKARVKVRQVARSSVEQHTGNYVKSIQRGKVWVEDGSVYNVRVYPKKKLAWYAGLIENGFMHKNGHFVPGKHVFENASIQFQGEYFVVMEEAFGKIVSKLP